MGYCVDLVLGVPHPGADGSVVEENRSVAPNKHWLTVFVYNVVVNPGGNDHVKHWDDPVVDGQMERSFKEYKGPIEDGKFAQSSNRNSSDRCSNFT